MGQRGSKQKESVPVCKKKKVLNAATIVELIRDKRHDFDQNEQQQVVQQQQQPVQEQQQGVQQQEQQPGQEQQQQPQQEQQPQLPDEPSGQEEEGQDKSKCHVPYCEWEGPTIAAAGCAHHICPECLAGYMGTFFDKKEADQWLVEPFRVPCLMAREEHCSSMYADTDVQNIIGEERYQRVCVQLPAENRAKMEENQLRIASLREKFFRNEASEDELLAEALRFFREPNDSGFKFLMCPKCKAGPFPKPRCDDVARHHGDSDGAGGGFISNACFACGFCASNASQWEIWDGVIRRDRVAIPRGSETIVYQTPVQDQRYPRLFMQLAEEMAHFGMTPNRHRLLRRALQQLESAIRARIPPREHDMMRWGSTMHHAIELLFREADTFAQASSGSFSESDEDDETPSQELCFQPRRRFSARCNEFIDRMSLPMQQRRAFKYLLEEVGRGIPGLIDRLLNGELSETGIAPAVHEALTDLFSSGTNPISILEIKSICIAAIKDAGGGEYDENDVTSRKGFRRRICQSAAQRIQDRMLRYTAEEEMSDEESLVSALRCLLPQACSIRHIRQAQPDRPITDILRECERDLHHHIEGLGRHERHRGPFGRMFGEHDDSDDETVRELFEELAMELANAGIDPREGAMLVDMIIEHDHNGDDVIRHLCMRRRRAMFMEDRSARLGEESEEGEHDRERAIQRCSDVLGRIRQHEAIAQHRRAHYEVARNGNVLYIRHADSHMTVILRGDDVSFVASPKETDDQQQSQQMAARVEELSLQTFVPLTGKVVINRWCVHPTYIQHGSRPRDPMIRLTMQGFQDSNRHALPCNGDAEAPHPISAF